ncbi:MAG TPA: CRISPR-associated endonuclease Cas1, partial [Aggregatilineales bacterium]|nr:CRISPR-associated endonuclease Cas1 [Aggregatilineales bacterium]
LLKVQVDVIFMTQNGTYLGHLIRNESKLAELRHLQLRLCDNESRSLAIARQVVMGKIHNQMRVLEGWLGADSHPFIEAMRSMRQSASTAIDIDQLRGWEGKAAHYYFEGLRRWLAPEWGFTARQYHPPPDPFNALLSFAYTLLLKDIEAKIQVVGLDSYLGFFHTLGYNRPALALDLMEEFRPIVADLVVLTVVREGKITPAHFEKGHLPELPIRINRGTMIYLIKAYEERLQEKVFHPLANGRIHYRMAMEYQARHMARVVRGEAPDFISLEG